MFLILEASRVDFYYQFQFVHSKSIYITRPLFLSFSAVFTFFFFFFFLGGWNVFFFYTRLFYAVLILIKIN